MSQKVLTTGFLKLILLHKYFRFFRRQNDERWKRGFTFFSTPISGKGDVVEETAQLCFYDYRHYSVIDEDDLMEWRMYEARLPGASKSYTRCIIGFSLIN